MKKEQLQEFVEQRIIRATKEKVTQKLLCISKNLGKAIISQTLFNNTFDSQEDMIYDPELTLDEAGDYYSRNLGFHFDGLRYGINLCVTSLIYDDKLDELKATYNGYLVYAETQGEVKAYAPFPTWENAMNMFYEGALQVEKKRAVEKTAKRKEENVKKLNGFMDKFKKIWGY